MDTIIIWCIVAIVAIYFALQVRKKNPANGPEWQILYSVGLPKTPTKSGKWWKIVGPARPGHLNYVPWYKPFKVSLGQTIRVVLKVTGAYTPVDGYEGQIATTALMFNRRGDRPNEAVDAAGTGPGPYNTWRLYSKVRPELKEGLVEFDVKVDAANLGAVMGGIITDDDVQANISDLESINLVFGGGSGAGHGAVQMIPGSSIELVELYII